MGFIRGVKELKGCTNGIVIFQPTPKPILKSLECIWGANESMCFIRRVFKELKGCTKALIRFPTNACQNQS